MSRSGMGCCKNTISTSVFDPRKEIFGPEYVKRISNTLDHNLFAWDNDTCKPGYVHASYLKRGDKGCLTSPRDSIVDRCLFVEERYPTWHRSVDEMKERTIEELRRQGKW